MVIRKLKGNESGATLLETLVALAILGLVAVAFLGGLSTGAKATIVANERTTAESLAQSQMEYVKSQDYDSRNNPQYTQIPDNPTGYDIFINAERLDAKDDGHENDDGIQKITVTVSHNGNLVLTVEGYKVER
ncbi:prepilin-type N-terminal cleavage/methylation domain-containing protein [Chloroflexota bacterium]